jgi:hypothetical protein
VKNEHATTADNEKNMLYKYDRREQPDNAETQRTLQLSFACSSVDSKDNNHTYAYSGNVDNTTNVCHLHLYKVFSTHTHAHSARDYTTHN